MEDKALSDTVNQHSDINQRITRSKSLVSDTRKSLSEERGHSHVLSMVLEHRDHLHSELIGKIRVIEYLKDREEDVNVVATELVGWEELFRKFQVCAKDYIDKLDSQDKKDDAVEWYQTECNGFHKFHSRLSTWVKGSTSSPEDSQDVRPKDSISQVESKTSSVRSAKVNALAKRAELIANQKKLKEMHLIEEEETKLKQRIEEEETKLRQRKEEEETKLRQRIEEEETRLRQRKERLDLETEIEIANAQFEIYDQFDTQLNVIDTNQRQNPSLNPQAVEFRPTHTQNSQPQLEETHSNLIPQQSTQQKDLVQFIVENQKLSSLPVRKIQTFSGKPVDYKPFIRSFEHGIEEKTRDPRDRLYYLDQYTSGEPNDLVRSCIHMDPVEGYQTARSLLDKRFGNKYKLATAHIAKALNWPSIKTEDAEALTSFSIFLTSCGNTMKDIEYMRELDHPKNLRDIAFKLPYKLRERWRTVSLPIIERRPITFLDFAEFVDRQAQILTNPIFGDICDDRRHHKVDPREPKKLRSFATETKKEERKSDNLSEPNKVETEERRYQQSKAFTKPCWFCDNHHSLDRCRNFQGLSLQEKIDFLRPKGLCFGCLQVGHTSRECLNRLACQICNRIHATCFHDNSRDHPREYSPKKVSTNSVAASINSTTTGEVSCMPVVPVRVKSRSSNTYVETYAFLDNGSSATFCTDKLAKELKISGKKTEIIVNTLNQRKQVDTSLIEELEISDIQGSQWIKLPTVFTQVKMPISKATIPKEEFFKQWPHLEDISLAPIDAEIGLLIGNNVPQAMEPQEVIKSENEGPYAVRTLLGWTINGLMQECGPGEEDCLNYVSVNRTDILADHALERQLKEYFNREFNEKSSNDKPEMSQNDKQFLEIMTATKKLKDGHYQMALPFKDPSIKLPNNKAQAEQRLSSLKRKFDKKPSFFNDYKVFMKDLFDKDFAQEVPLCEKDRNDGRVWYIPHHGVYHPKKPEKIRVVFDCAAEYKGYSLNKQLLQGPDLTNTLIGVLLRFRQYPVALMADIKAMFYQVRVQPDNYDVLRFLWWPNGNTEDKVKEYQMKVHLFGAASSPSCSNFALKETAKDNREDFRKEVLQTVEKNFYVDDCLKSVESEEEAVAMATDLRNLCEKGGFRLTKWISNSRLVIDSIPEEDRSKEVKDLDIDDNLPIERALGVQWCVESDKFKFKITIKDKPTTRRGILSTVSSVYDPLGFAGPFILKAKGILQDLCRLKIGWDDAIPAAIQKEWDAWLQELKELDKLLIDRCIQSETSNKNAETQIHHFSDASQSGYGTVSYLRQRNDNGDINCRFLMSKSRVAPLKEITIPRLELAAATVAVRVDSMLRRELEIPIKKSYFWTDSMSVLRYISNSTSRFHTFVANRVSVIHEGSSPSQWKYVDTKQNPADEASRGLSIGAFLTDTRWFNGPDFLHAEENLWPTQESVSLTIPKEDAEVKKSAYTNLTNHQSPCTGLQKLINHYSDWFALKKAIAWLLRIKVALLQRSKKRKGIPVLSAENSTFLTIRNLEESEGAIIKYVQMQSFPKEMEILISGNSAKVGKSSPLCKLDPFIEGGLMRVGGRLNKARMPESSKHPVILPKDSHVSRLIIRHIHIQCGHSGRNFVLSSLFQKYWMIKANAAVRKEIHNCVRCRREHAPVQNQKMADLPAERITPDKPPFTYVGVDYFGPFDVKQRRSHVKRYGVLFTCLTTRAVHIEIAQSLDTDSCINALRRFISRRGQVTKMWSDNGTNFVGSERELKEQIDRWNKNQIHQELLQRNIEWTFNPPTGSHHGGVWERQIRTVRKILRSVVKEQTLDEETLQTVLCEIESIINNRPITRASDDPGDLEALTPNHLLLMKKMPALPPGMVDDNYPRRRWRQVQYMADLFWKRWTREYLPLLQERQKWVKLRRNLRRGDVVLIVDNLAPRSSWAMGRVSELNTDSKGVVRTVRVRTQSSELIRPISKLCLLLESDC